MKDRAKILFLMVVFIFVPFMNKRNYNTIYLESIPSDYISINIFHAENKYTIKFLNSKIFLF